MAALSGSLRLLYFFDVCEEIDLDALRTLLQLEKPDREFRFRHQAPVYVKFEKPPLEERIPALRLATGENLPARIRYFDYGVLGIEIELAFHELDWPAIIEMAAKWMAAPDLESVAEATARRQLDRIMPAMRKPFSRLLTEDYTVLQLNRVLGDDGTALNSAMLLERYGTEIAQVVRGELGALSPSERQEILAASISYSPADLLVVGWTAAFVYDTQPESAQMMLQLLEYANTQLLEFRHYDDVLTHVLTEVYTMVEKRPGFLRRWSMAREAGKLNTYRLEVMELAERADNAIKFLSDMFYARAYKLASSRIGVSDYRTLVDEKQRTADELYRFLMDQFHQGRAFVLELMVVIILIIELMYLFRGKT